MDGELERRRGAEAEGGEGFHGRFSRGRLRRGEGGGNHDAGSDQSVFKEILSQRRKDRQEKWFATLESK
jgi:hypothetical protein